MSERYDEKGRKESGFANTTYKEVFDRFDRDGAEVRSSLPEPLRSTTCDHTLTSISWLLGGPGVH